MHVIQILLPLFGNDGQPFADSTMADIREELLVRFGGVTAFARTPAQGVWSHGGRRIHDDIMLVEVMAESLDREWWTAFRLRLEKRLSQDSIIVRAQGSERL